PALPLMVIAVANDPPLTVSLPTPAFTVNASTDPDASVMSVPPPSVMLVADAKLIVSALPDPTTVRLSDPVDKSMLKSLFDANGPSEKSMKNASPPLLPFTPIKFVLATVAVPPHWLAAVSVLSLSK